jgi:hypothetical protein
MLEIRRYFNAMCAPPRRDTNARVETKLQELKGGYMKTSTLHGTTIVDRPARLLGAALVCCMLMVSLAVSQSPAPVALASATSFAVLSSSGVTSTGATIINGDLGVSPGTGFTGAPTVNGATYIADSVAAQSKLDLTAAYNDAAGRTLNGINRVGNLGGLTLVPGLYYSATSMEISSGDLTLDGQGDANAVFIFQMGSTLVTTADRQVILTGSARAANIFWQVGSSATLGTNSLFKGNILALTSISLLTGAILDGRALAQNGGVTFDGNTVTMPSGITGVEGGSAAVAFRLSQNYPNPFNPSTKIEYSLEKAGMVSLRLFNVLGSEVATLVHGRQEAGTYAVQFNSNKETVGLSSGVYFYRLEAGPHVSVRKLILMR